MNDVKAYAKSLRRHVEYASGGLYELDEEKRAAFWRILEYQAAMIIQVAIDDATEAAAVRFGNTAPQGEG